MPYSDEPTEAELQQWEEIKSRRRVAKIRSERLFTRFLTHQQRYTFKYRQYVDVTSRSGLPFRIVCTRVTNNIFLLMPSTGDSHSTDYPGVRYCIHLDMDIPPADHWLAQLLLLRTDEEEFFRTSEWGSCYHSLTACHQPGWWRWSLIGDDALVPVAP